MSEPRKAPLRPLGGSLRERPRRGLYTQRSSPSIRKAWPASRGGWTTRISPRSSPSLRTVMTYWVVRLGRSTVTVYVPSRVPPRRLSTTLRTISVASSSWAPARRTAQGAASRARRRIPHVLSNRFAIRAMAFPPPIVPFLVLRFPGARLGTPHRLRGLEPGRPPGGEQGAEPHRHRHGDGGVEDVRGPYGAV